MIEAHPDLPKQCYDPNSVLESVADYWCNITNGFYLYRSYIKCPFINDAMPLYKDFSPQLHIQAGRAWLAGVALNNPPFTDIAVPDFYVQNTKVYENLLASSYRPMSRC